VARIGLVSLFVRHPIVLGLQYGDEGKGKITDSLARQSQWVIRFNGGSNAGHTLWLNGKKLVTHSVPSGVLYPHVKNFIGAGCVVDPVSLKKELEEISQAGSSLKGERLRIDGRAHLTLPIHIALDAAREGGRKGIGTTRKGIGPTYTTKMDRCGLRVCDLYADKLEEKLHFLCDTYNALIRQQDLPESSYEENWAVLEMARDLLREHVSVDPVPFWDVSQNEKCVLEGAQGVLLDLDHGTYPFVTSSNTLAAHAAAGTPFPMSRLGAVIGVAKVYMTRVGSGPFETEQDNEDGERIRAKGGEFGATTGRPRRVGWLNVDELKLAVRLSDCSHVVLTKADVLSGEPTVKLFVKGEYREFPCWKSIYKESSPEVLSEELEAYVAFIEKEIGVPIVGLGTGPDRADFHWRGEMPNFWSER
jgi:adenylosuccinate synthase